LEWEDYEREVRKGVPAYAVRVPTKDSLKAYHYYNSDSLYNSLALLLLTCVTAQPFDSAS
jgi:hypothetical protein